MSRCRESPFGLQSPMTPYRRTKRKTPGRTWQFRELFGSESSGCSDLDYIQLNTSPLCTPKSLPHRSPLPNLLSPLPITPATPERRAAELRRALVARYGTSPPEASPSFWLAPSTETETPLDPTSVAPETLVPSIPEDLSTLRPQGWPSTRRYRARVMGPDGKKRWLTVPGDRVPEITPLCHPKEGGRCDEVTNTMYFVFFYLNK